MSKTSGPEVDDAVQAIVHATLLGDGWAASGISAGIITEEGRYVACNEAMCKLTGYSRSEMLEMNAGARLAADDAARENYADAQSGERRWGFGDLRRKDGDVVGVNYWLIPTLVAQVPYMVALMWAAESGPDLNATSSTGPRPNRRATGPSRAPARPPGRPGG